MEARLRQKYASHNPPMATGTIMSAQVTVIVFEKFGSMTQNRSRYRISISHIASQTNFVTSRLNRRESNIANGTAKRKSTRNKPIQPHPPPSRLVYQVISSGKLPAQMISH